MKCAISPVLTLHQQTVTQYYLIGNAPSASPSLASGVQPNAVEWILSFHPDFTPISPLFFPGGSPAAALARCRVIRAHNQLAPHLICVFALRHQPVLTCVGL